MPSLSGTTGGTDVRWVEIPVGRRRFPRRPVQRLPLDPRSARLARRYLRVEPWASPARLAALLTLTTVDIVDRSAPTLPIWIVVWLGVIVSSTPRLNGVLPRQSPYRTAAGDLRVPDVPIEVAKQWVEQNPGVIPTVEPDPRPRSRRWYATSSAVLLISAIVLFTVLANNGREDSLLVRAAVLSLFFVGIATASRMLPRGYIRVGHDDS
ncbi:hypothetical protein [Paractinoplanes globisporus]|uniref:hypothetical protein n=1 Tax=Paractinoplanes globisporus TaxID=113565 RepID=UPI00146CEA04|nr:hypothetical protein [Actinoplanes globisporus]